jgi:hypothetical protein
MAARSPSAAPTPARGWNPWWPTAAVPLGVLLAGFGIVAAIFLWPPATRPPDRTPRAEAWLPLIEGCTWTYRVLDPDSEKWTTREVLMDWISAEPDRIRARIRQEDGRRTRSLALSEDEAGLWQESWHPQVPILQGPRPRLLLPRTIGPGSTWDTSFPDRGRADWRIPEGEVAWVSRGHQIRVPAGTFDCLELRVTLRSGAGHVTCFLAPGVGLVKQTWEDADDELRELVELDSIETRD